MYQPIKVIDLEITDPLADIGGLEHYSGLKILLRMNGTPISFVEVPLSCGEYSAHCLRKTIFKSDSWPIALNLLRTRLQSPLPTKGFKFEKIVEFTPPDDPRSLPLFTVAVCTRDRAENLQLCLDALNRLNYPNLDIIVVDNAPSNNATERLVRRNYPNMRYILEPRPGLNWARNRAILESKGEIIAYTDDDVVVDSEWVRAYTNLFLEDPDVMAATGLVIPFELETEAQMLFEMYGGFGRGFQRKWVRVEAEKDPWRWHLWGTGQFGTGANMAFRRSLFDKIGYFDPALDVGTVTNGGGDLEMFFRVLVEGHTLVYEPNAIIRHRHRPEYGELRKQLTNNGIGLYSYFTCGSNMYPSQRLPFIRLGLFWLRWWHFRRLLLSFIYPYRFPRDLILAEFMGVFKSFGRYHKACKSASKIARSYSNEPTPPSLKLKTSAKKYPQKNNPIAVRWIDLASPLSSISDITDYKYLRIVVSWGQNLLGEIHIANHFRPVSALQLREAIASEFGYKILTLDKTSGTEDLWTEITSTLKRHYMITEERTKESQSVELPVDVPVSIVVTTRDRPEDLCNCLCSLMAQNTKREMEIIVVDNNPSSGLTQKVVIEFARVILLNEPRNGSSYGRNAGIVSSKGEIIVTVDDDVIVPPDWLERIIAPFVRQDVMIVTGNTLPSRLDTKAQQLFEIYGGLGRGFERFEVNAKWFSSFRYHAVPTWKLGGTANSAFRASIFNHPQIGLMEVTLGAGIPTGTGEDIYLFYKTLKAGYSIVYEPKAFVWHRHRSTMKELRYQIYQYSKGHVAYHLTTLIRDRDLRALPHVTFHMPRWRVKQILRHLRNLLNGRKNDYPLSLLLIEIAGNLLGPLSLWKTNRELKRQDRNYSYGNKTNHSACLDELQAAGKIMDIRS